MRNLINALFFFTFLLFLTCCDSTDRRADRTNVYFDVKSFVDAQIVLLNSKNPNVTKTMFSDGRTETRAHKNINWKKELELFAQVDINKPAYVKSYKIINRDSLTHEYILKPGETLPVQKLKVLLNSNSGKPHLIQAVLLSKNKLYESKKNVEFECEDISGQWSIVSYHIKGYQKLAVMDSKEFEIRGVVHF